MFKRFLILFSTVILIIMPFSVKAENSLFAQTTENYSENEFITVSKVDDLELFVVASGSRAGEFYVLNQKSGATYHSNPISRSTDLKTAMDNPELNSQFTASIYNGNTGAIKTVYSFNASRNGKDVKVSINNSGFTAQYGLNNNTLSLTLDVKLSSEGVEVSCKNFNTEKNSYNKITNVSLLPYFGATEFSEDGYILVPDGSGAIIENGSATKKTAVYSQEIYGSDLAFDKSIKKGEQQKIYLPIFGIKGENHSVFGIVKEGKFSAKINAQAAKNIGEYNRANVSFDLIGRELLSLGESGNGSVSSDYIYADDMPLTRTCSVFYRLMSKDSGYVEMADYYRSFLGLKDNDKLNSKLFLEVYGGLVKKESTFGIPVNKFKKLTTVSQAIEICNFFKESSDSDLILSYMACDSAIIAGKMQNKFSFKSALGKKNELEKLQTLLSDSLYFENDVLSATSSGNGVWKFLDLSSRINKKSALAYTYSRSTNGIDSAISPSFILKPKSVTKIYNKYFKSLNSKGYNPAFTNLANVSYSDFNKKNYTSRKATAEKFTELIKENSSNSLLYTPTDYTLGLSNNVVDIPCAASDFDACKEYVPFYGLVLSGTCNYAGESVNLNSNSRISFLNCLESGASLKFTFVYQNSDAIKDTKYAYLFGANFNTVKAKALEYQKEYEQIKKTVGGKRIIEHKILGDGIRLIEYDNGNAVLINYNLQSVDTDYGTVDALAYLTIVKGGEVIE